MHQAAACESKDWLHCRAWAGVVAEEQNPLCTVVPLSGTLKGRVAVGKPEGAAGGRGAGVAVKAGL